MFINLFYKQTVNRSLTANYGNDIYTTYNNLISIIKTMCYYRIVFVDKVLRSCNETIQAPFITEKEFFYETNNGRIICGLLKAQDAQHARAEAESRLQHWHIQTA